MRFLQRMVSRSGRVAVTFGLLLPAGSWCQLTPHLTGVALACLGSSTGFSGTLQQSCDLGFDENVVTSGGASLSVNLGSSALGAQAAVNTLGSAAYGILHASASSNFTIVRPGGAKVFADGFAAFDEVMTVMAGGDCGLPGILVPTYSISGNVSASGQGAAFAEVFVEVDELPPVPFQQESKLYSKSVSINDTMPSPFHFTYCQPFGFQLWINAPSGTVFPGILPNGMPQGEGANAIVGEGVATVDFSHTVVLSGLRVFDSQMNPVTNATFSSASGTPYTSQGVGLPVAIEIGVDDQSEKEDEPTSINPQRYGHIDVAVLSTPTFDAVTTVNESSLTFGHLGIEHSLAFCNGEGEDVNGDGLPDLVCHFDNQRADFQLGDTAATLRGQTKAGVQIVGAAPVRIRSGY